MAGAAPDRYRMRSRARSGNILAAWSPTIGHTRLSCSGGTNIGRTARSADSLDSRTLGTHDSPGQTAREWTQRIDGRMTRRNRLGGAFIAALWVAAAVTLAILLPGKGASAGESVGSCDTSSASSAPTPPADTAPIEADSAPGSSDTPTCTPTDTAQPSATDSTTASDEPTTTPTATDTDGTPGDPTPTDPTSPPTSSSSGGLPPPVGLPSGGGPGKNSGSPPGQERPPPHGSSTPPASTPPDSTSPSPTDSGPAGPPYSSTPSTTPTANPTEPKSAGTPDPSAGTPPRSDGGSSVIPPLNSLGANGPGNSVSHAPGPTASTLPPGVPPSTTASNSAGAPTTSNQTGGDGGTRTTSSKDKSDKQLRSNLAAKSAVGSDDSLLLVALVLGFTFAVSGVVVAAGLRGG